MPTYLVETYMARSREDDACVAGRRVRAEAERLAREGVRITYVRTTFLTEDETCFHVFEAASAAAVDEVCRRAQLGRARIVPVVESTRTQH